MGCVIKRAVYTVYLLIYRTAKNNYFRNCLGIIGTDFYRACEVSVVLKQLYLKGISQDVPLLQYSTHCNTYCI